MVNVEFPSTALDCWNIFIAIVELASVLACVKMNRIIRSKGIKTIGIGLFCAAILRVLYSCSSATPSMLVFTLGSAPMLVSIGIFILYFDFKRFVRWNGTERRKQ